MPSVIDIVVGLNTSAVKPGVEHMREQVSEMKHSFVEGFAEIASVGFFVEMGKQAIELGDTIGNLSEQFQISTTKLQVVGNAAKVHNAEITDVASAYNKLVINQQKAIETEGEQRDAFNEMGIAVADLLKLGPDELFDRVADATKNAKDRGEQYANVVALMGKSAGGLYTTLEMGSKGIRDLGESMGVLDETTIKALSSADDNIKKFQQNVTVAFGTGISWAMRLVSALALVDLQVVTGMAIYWNKLKGDSDRAEQLWQNLKKVNAEQWEYIKTGKQAGGEGGEEKARIDEDRQARFQSEERAAEACKKEAEAESKKNAEELLTLVEKLNDVQAQAAEDALTAEQKIKSLKEDIAFNAKVIGDLPGGSNDQVRVMVRQAEAQKKLAELQRAEDTRKAAAAKALAEANFEYQKMLADRARKWDEEQFERQFRYLHTTAQQREALVEREAKLKKELAETPSPMAEATFKKIDEIRAVQGRISDLDNATPGQRQADSLARIGGGGNVAANGVPSQQLAEAKLHTTLLRSIAAQAGGLGGGVLQP